MGIRHPKFSLVVQYRQSNHLHDIFYCTTKSAFESLQIAHTNRTTTFRVFFFFWWLLNTLRYYRSKSYRIKPKKNLMQITSFVWLVNVCLSLDKSTDKKKIDASIEMKAVWGISSGREAEQWNRALEVYTWSLLNDWDTWVLV